MVTLTIVGREITVPEGTSLVEASAVAGVDLPTYCYHPGIPVVGQCRICFVEIEGLPRLVTACSTPAQSEMVVHTGSERVREARAAVMEFLLENHPLDCPVCDQAGECGLQDYSVEHGLDSTHMVDERRTNPGRERHHIGPHIVQNQNRCIHCTRCIRFTTEISETSDLTMKSRGHHSYIDTFDGRPLENPWSACAADICPVGALTVKEFRFRARVWHLEETKTICPGCSIGCNVLLGHLKGVVHRFVPRENAEINGWWMCDYGRFLAESLEHRTIDVPLEGTGENQRRISWDGALAQVAEWFRDAPQTLVVASANMCNEALYAVRRNLAEGAQMEVIVPINEGEVRRIKNGRGNWMTSTDNHPNSAGVRHLGLTTVDAANLESYLRDGTGPVLILDAHAHPWLESAAAAAVAASRQAAVLARYGTPLVDTAQIVMPVASWAETEGTFTSSTGRVQLTNCAFPPVGQARRAWEIVYRLAVDLGIEQERTVTTRILFAEMAAEVAAFSGMTWGRLSAEPGMPVHEEVVGVG